MLNKIVTNWNATGCASSVKKTEKSLAGPSRFLPFTIIEGIRFLTSVPRKNNGPAELLGRHKRPAPGHRVVLQQHLRPDLSVQDDPDSSPGRPRDFPGPLRHRFSVSVSTRSRAFGLKSGPRAALMGSVPERFMRGEISPSKVPRRDGQEQADRFALDVHAANSRST